MFFVSYLFQTDVELLRANAGQLTERYRIEIGADHGRDHIQFIRIGVTHQEFPIPVEDVTPVGINDFLLDRSVDSVEFITVGRKLQIIKAPYK